MIWKKSFDINRKNKITFYKANEYNFSMHRDGDMPTIFGTKTIIYMKNNLIHRLQGFAVIYDSGEAYTYFYDEIKEWPK